MLSDSPNEPSDTRLQAKSIPPLRIGDQFEYSGPQGGNLKVTVLNFSEVRDPQGNAHRVVPFLHEIIRAGKPPIPRVAFVSREDGRLVFGHFGCLKAEGNPEPRCADYWMFNFASSGSPSPMLIGTLSGISIQKPAPTILLDRIENAEAPQAVTYSVLPAADDPLWGGCIKIEANTTDFRTRDGTGLPPTWTLPISATFCEGAPAPVSYTVQASIQFTYRLEGYTQGHAGADVSLHGPLGAKGTNPLPRGPLMAGLPPEGAKRFDPFPTRAAFEAAKAKDIGFSGYIDDNPSAVLRRSLYLGKGEGSIGGFPAEHPLLTQERASRLLEFGIPGEPGGYRITIDRTEGLNRTDYQVFESAEIQDAVPTPASLSGQHVTLLGAFELASELIPTPIAGVDILTTFQTQTGATISTESQFHYRLRFESDVETEVENVQLLYMLDVASRDGQLLFVAGPAETAAAFLAPDLIDWFPAS